MGAHVAAFVKSKHAETRKPWSGSIPKVDFSRGRVPQCDVAEPSDVSLMRRLLARRTSGQVNAQFSPPIGCSVRAVDRLVGQSIDRSVGRAIAGRSVNLAIRQAVDRNIGQWIDRSPSVKFLKIDRIVVASDPFTRREHSCVSDNGVDKREAFTSHVYSGKSTGLGSSWK